MLIIIVSLIPVPDVDTGINHSDKIIHFLIYFIMLSWFGQSGLYANKLIANFSLTILFGIGIEVLQSFTSYRQFDIYDIYANSLGALLAYLLLLSRYQYLLNFIDHQIKLKLN
ncbi:MAG: VanZ family protein [Gammaproteobacteria bacterium]|nr:VanZ family protein [Gammaproteobacteria bacterium]